MGKDIKPLSETGVESDPEVFFGPPIEKTNSAHPTGPIL